jgi:hypothetical protein
MSQYWTLKDKNGNPPSPDDYNKCMSFLQRLDRNLLFPCPRSPDELEMEKKNSDIVPKEMNSFGVNWLMSLNNENFLIMERSFLVLLHTFGMELVKTKKRVMF